MRALRTLEELEAVVGTRPKAMMMKAVDSLDDGCMAVLSDSPLAAVGFRDETGTPWATMVGAVPRVVTAVSPTEVTFDLPAGSPRPPVGGWVSIVNLLPGIGETLRITGQVTDRRAAGLSIAVLEAWTHCAKCIRRSGLWEVPATIEIPAQPELFGVPKAGDLLAASPFAIVTSFDRERHSDTSPRGDRPGFIRVIDDGRALALPDRKGNRRTDTFHNLIECDDIALAAIVPGRLEVVHVSGRGSVTDDRALLESMALNERPPHAALVIDVDAVAVVESPGIRDGRMWDTTAHVDPDTVPDLMSLGAEHLARSKEKGAAAAATRVLSRGLAASPRILRRGVEHGYRKELEDEGFAE